MKPILKDQSLIPWMVNTGLLLVMAGTVLPLLQLSGAAGDLWRWLYTAGAALILIGRLLTVHPDAAEASLRKRRLWRLETWSAMFFAVGCFFIFFNRPGQMDWLAFTMAGAAVQAYVGFMLGRTK